MKMEVYYTQSAEFCMAEGQMTEYTYWSDVGSEFGGHWMTFTLFLELEAGEVPCKI